MLFIFFKGKEKEEKVSWDQRTIPQTRNSSQFPSATVEAKIKGKGFQNTIKI